MPPTPDRLCPTGSHDVEAIDGNPVTTHCIRYADEEPSVSQHGKRVCTIYCDDQHAGGPFTVTVCRQKALTTVEHMLQGLLPYLRVLDDFCSGTSSTQGVSYQHAFDALLLLLLAVSLKIDPAELFPAQQSVTINT